MKYEIIYAVGNTYKNKVIEADNATEAIKKARVKHIVDIDEFDNAIPARKLCDAIRKFADSPEALDNFESYLSYHFAAWLKRFANNPQAIAGEFEHFANMEF